MSGWNNETAEGFEDWKDGGDTSGNWNETGGNTNGTTDDAWGTGANGFGVDASGGFGETNGDAAPSSDITCRRCHEPGHMARECPSAPEGGASDGKCFNCGQEGHTKADCTNPRVFTGTCRLCQEQGHPASECPSKPPVKCYNCKEEGHAATECTSKRVFDRSGLPDLDVDSAWEGLKQADKQHDLDDFREAFQVYTKACPDATYLEMEQSFRLNNFGVYLIAIEKELQKTHTFVSLQGELDQKYQASFHFSPKPKRKTQEAAWPGSEEENLERLTSAGMPMERGIPKCTRCDGRH
ncbi:hypothetical protein ACLMJK_000624 [Lecanora helva]